MYRRDEAKQQLVAGLGLECVEYRSCKPDASRPVPVNARMENLNWVLKKMYPKTSPAGPHEVVAVFDDDQVRQSMWLSPLIFDSIAQDDGVLCLLPSVCCDTTCLLIIVSILHAVELCSSSRVGSGGALRVGQHEW